MGSIEMTYACVFKREVADKKILEIISENRFIENNRLLFHVDGRVVEWEIVEKKIGHAYFLSFVTRSDEESRSLFDKFSDFEKELKITMSKNHCYVIIYHDDISRILAKELYVYLEKYERVLRKLIYTMILPSLGSRWVAETKDSQYESVKGILPTHMKIEEHFLEMFELYQIQSFLFDKRLLDVDSSDGTRITFKLNEMGANEFLESLNAVEGVYKEPYSLWDKYFQPHIEIDDLEVTLKEIRLGRNTVMHNRSIDVQKSNELIEMLEGIILSFERIITDSHLDKFNDDEIQDEAENLVETLDIIASGIVLGSNGIAEQLGKSYVDMSKLGSSARIAEQLGKSYVDMSKLGSSARIAEQLGKSYVDMSKLGSSAKIAEQLGKSYVDMSKLGSSAKIAEQLGKSYVDMSKLGSSARIAEQLAKKAIDVDRMGNDSQILED